MNVTVCPEQTDVDAVEIVTDAAASGVTVIVTEFEVAGDPVAQDALDVITQVTTSPFPKEDEMYVLLLVPTFDPFLFH